MEKDEKMTDKESNKILEYLEEITKWLSFLGKREVKMLILDNLTDDRQLLIYHNSDGNKGSKELASYLKASDVTISGYWDEWAKIGIIKKIKAGRGSRGKKIFTLEELGIEIPDIK